MIRWLKLATVAIKAILHFSWIYPERQKKKRN